MASSTRVVRLLVLTLACQLIPGINPAYGGTPSQFESVEDLMEAFSDYTTENGTFKILKKQPLQIQVSSTAIPGETQEVIEAELKRALIYAIYRSFIHTPVERITVTSVPLELDVRTRATRYLPHYKRTITMTKGEALAAVRRHLHVRTLAELVTETRVGEWVLSDQWTRDFERLYYDDQGPPGMTRFFEELAH